MTRKIDLTGKIFGRLAVIKRGNNDKRGQCKWICICECGNIKEITGSVLRGGKSHSCGCIQKEVVSKMMSTHKMSHTLLHQVFGTIKDRCCNSKCKAYSGYGGRGITICNEWRYNFMSFYNWANENGYKKGLSIDRIDNNGNYCPENCRWTTMKEQNNNRRDNIIVNYNGNLIGIIDAAKLSGINLSTLRSRVIKNYSLDKLFIPVISK